MMGKLATGRRGTGEPPLVTGGTNGLGSYMEPSYSGSNGDIQLKNHGRCDADTQIRRKHNKFKVPGIGCFKLKVVEDMDGNIDVQAVGDDHSLPLPTHLIVAVNGIIGSAENWKFIAKQFVREYPQDVMVHCSRTNCRGRTFDGVDVMGDRLAKEVLSVVKRHQSVKKISFLGHSLGGLIARYAIARLYKSEQKGELVPTIGHEQADPTAAEQRKEETIAGLEPMNFITLATPHLGSRAHKQVPLFCASYALEKTAARLSWFLGRTGKHLFLTDGENGKPPLLVQMTRDTDLKFMSALQSFERRVTYANVRFDCLVGWSTSSLRSSNTMPKAKHLSSDAKYRHIVHLRTPATALPLEESKNHMGAYEEEMLRSLTRISWERVDVKFNGRKQIFLAHNSIQVQNHFLHSKGTDVIQHMVDTFLLV